MHVHPGHQHYVKQLVLLWCFFLCNAVIFAQSPGGVNANLKLWLKANTGVTGTTNVSAWTDQSGAGDNATQSIASQQPSLIASDLNFNPSVNFAGGTSILNFAISTPDLNSTVFTVGIPTVNTSWRTMFRGSVRDHPLIIQSGGNTLGFYDNNVGALLSSGFTWLANEPALVGLEMMSGNVNFRKNGTQGAAITTVNLTGASLDFFGNFQTSPQNQNFGRIAETIVYNSATALTTTEKNKIESYLGVKYGLTLAHDYLASDGTTIWNSTTNATYNNNITGIGRDDNSALNQQKSVGAYAAATITVNHAAAFPADKNFLLFGDDAGTGTSANTPSSYQLRSNRIWKAAVAGASIGAAFSIDLSAIGLINTGFATDYAVLVNASTDFSSGAVINTAGATLVGNVLSFSNVNFNDGNFFTLAVTNIRQPGGVAGLEFWVKANAGVTGTTMVSSWADQSGYNNATQATPSQEPSLINTDLNFNPSINFAGATTYFNITTPPANLNSTIFTVGVPNPNTNWRTLFRGAANDHPLIVQSGGTALGYYDNDDVGFKPSGFTWLQNEPAVVGLEMRAGNVNFRKNGTQGGAITTINLSGLALTWFGNYQSNSQPFGRVPETLIYNTASPLTTTDKNKIESYLAVKYGLTLTHDYLTSSGTVLWNSTTNAANASDLTAIGRDDVSALDQRQSKSSNAGTVLTLAKSTPAAAFGADQNFLIAGDDAGSLGATTIGVPTGFPAFPMRVTRIWKTQLTGTPGSVTVSFDLGTGIFNSGTAANYSLLTSSTADFSSSTPIASGTISSNVISFSGINLTDGLYFTLGLPLVSSPGGVVNGLRVWLKANKGVSSDAAGTVPATDLGSVQQWDDASSLGNNATNTGTPIFNLTNNLINFNPTVYYDGASGHNLAYSSANEHSLITVSRMEGTRNGRAFSSRVGNTLLGYWNNLEDVFYLDGNPSILSGKPASTAPRLYADTRATSGAWLFDRNGLTLSSGPSSFNSTIQLGIANGGTYSGESSKMFVSEVIQYDHDITATELNKVQSYLAIKYGITLDQTTPADYVASDGTVIWNGTSNATYRNNITGIGRDDAAALSQQRSRSVNDRSVVIFDKGSVFAADKNFIVFGSDNTILTPTKVNAAPGYPNRTTRVWRAQVTGTPGAVSVSFDLGIGIFNSGVVTDYALLIKNADPNFSTGATAYTTGASFSGSVLTFTGVNFSNGDYFSLAMPNVPAPGGVVSNLQLWLKANQGVVGSTTASSWNDQSGNGFNVVQATPANQPGIQASRVNFNPALVFNGAGTSLGLSGGFLGTQTYSDANVFVISRVNSVSNSSIFYEPTTGGQFNAHIPWSDNNLYWDAGNTGTNRLSVNAGAVTGLPYLWSLAASTTFTAAGANQDIYRNGQRIASDLTMSTWSGNNSNLTIGTSFTNYYNGEISEVVVYTGPLTATQFLQIQSYLALKYGVTLNQTIPQNYLSSAGVPIFHATSTHAGYIHDIAGIGRDDNAALDQRKSKSINVTPADIFSMANVDFTTPAAFGANAQYMIWGNNGLSLSSDITMAPYTQAGSTIVRQIARLWSTDKTGTQTGNAIIEIDMSLINGPTGLGTNNTADVRLLIDNDAIFGNSSAGEHAYSLSSASGGKIYFTVPWSDFTAGQSFVTIGSVNAATAPLFAPAPGGIAADIRLWLDANKGITGTTTAAAWADQSPNAFNVVQPNAAKQPTILSNRLNGNKSLSFDGASDDMNIFNGILRGGVYSDVYVYAASRNNVLQNAKFFAEANAAGGQFGAYLPWSNDQIYWDAGDWGSANRLNVASGETDTTPYLWSLGGSTVATPSGARQDIYRNGLLIGSDNTMNSFSGNNSLFALGSQLGSNFYNGEMSEVLIVTSVINSSQHQRIQSYFALKYGLTLNQTTPTNYFSSINAIIFHATTTQLNYKNDIAGIGRDDNMLLDQRKSKSVNSPSDIFSVAAGNFSTPTAFGSDQQFMVWGNNGLPNAADAISAVTQNAIVMPKRLARVWSTDKNAAISGNAVVEFNMALIVGPTGIGTNTNADVRLLIDGDGTFGNASSGELTLSPDSGFGMTGGTIYFTVPFSSIPSPQGFLTIGSVNAITCPLGGPMPGGVAAPVKIWLNANVGVTGGANVSSWADQSSNAFVATQATPANQPAALTTRLNFNSAVSFNGSSSFLTVPSGILGVNSYTDFDVFLVSRVNTISSAQSFAENVSGGQFAGYTPWSDNNIYWDAGNNSTNRLSVNWGGAAGNPYLFTLAASTTATATGALQDIYRNGKRLATDNTMNTFFGAGNGLYIGSGVGGNYYNGEISEYLVYSASLTALQQQRVQSYLAIKYGLTIDQTIPTNYVSSTAQTIWSSSVNSSYASDIAGIGRDDASGLDQRKSKSVNASAVFTIEKTTPGSPFASDLNFIVTGDDGGSLGASTTGVPTSFPIYPMRVTRIWKTQLTGAPGTATVSFDLGTGIYNSGVASNYALLISSTPDFSSSTPITGGTIAANVISFAGVALNDGFYLTLALPLVPSPGGVINGLRVWLKANAGVSSDAAGTIAATDLGAVQQWNDQTSLKNNATATGIPIFNTSANLINFNPTVYYDGASGHNLSYSSVNTHSLVTVSRMEGTLSRRAFSTRIGNTLLGYWNGQEDCFYLNGNPSIISGRPVATTNPRMYADTQASGGTWVFNRNGLLLSTGPTSTPSTIQLGISNGGTYSGESSKQYVSEVIQYDHDITAAELNKVQSYLSIKYGLTLDQTVAANYVSADGTVFWNGTTNAAYKTSITGIGRDDAAALDQRKSQSVNPKSFITMDLGGPFASNKNFLVWASDNASTGLTTTGTFPGYPYRIVRTWKTAVTGTPGAVTLSFDLSQGIYNSGSASNYQLLLKTTDTNFSSGATGISGTLSGNILTFAGVTFVDGEFFTLGLLNVPAPGGVVPNMQFWVKGNAGVTGTSNVSIWADQAGSDDAFQNTPSAQPSLVNVDLNYNPSINFGGTSTIMSLTTPPVNLNSTIFTVAVPTINTNWRTMFRGVANDHPIIIQSGGTALGYYDTKSGGFKASGFTWLQNEPAVVSLEMRTGAVAFRKNGSLGANINSITLTGVTLDYFGNYQGGAQNFGRISETVIYNNSTALTTTEKNRIESYFAVKYGITLTHDYLASDATVIWNAATNATYHNDVAGIGRDDNSALNQKQSQSTNPGNILSIGNGTGSLAIDNNTNVNNFGADKSLYIWGHNNKAVAGSGVIDFGTTTNGEVIKTRLARAWLGVETGTIGTVHLVFDLSQVKGPGGVPGTNDLSKTRLLVDADGVFAAGAFSVSPITFNNGTGIVEFEFDFIPAKGFYFSIGSIDLTAAPLPVELVEFEAVAKEDFVDLTWVTASELNNDYFSIQSSIDNEAWYEVVKVKGKGTTANRSAYEARDDAPFIGTSYYRLAQVDLDGTTHLSDTRVVEFQGAIKLYPNPTIRKHATLVVPTSTVQLWVSISNLLGQEVYRTSISGTGQRQQTLELDLTNLVAGEYLIRVVNGEQIVYRKLMVD